MNLNDYFNPISLEKPVNHLLSEKAILCRNIYIHTPDTPISDLFNYQVALMGIPEDRNSGIKGSAGAPDLIRNRLYQLFKVNPKIKIIDLGNLKPGKTVQDTYFALRDITLEVKDRKLILICFGGTQDLTYGTYLAFEKAGVTFNFVTIDSRLDIGIIHDEISPETYLIPILSRKKELLFNYTNLGHQKYLVDQQDIDFLQQHFHDSVRLGDIRSGIAKSEPILRDAGFVSFDLNAIRQSDAPGCTYPSPNGLYAEEACQLSWYAGLSNKLSTFGVYNLLPETDILEQTSFLAAQMIWYFLDGVSQRKTEIPSSKSTRFKKFIVSLTHSEDEIVFYKSLDTSRWWFEVPVLSHEKKRKVVISCSHEDYLSACNQEIPDRWLKAFRKMN